jgi:hypothetical protein
MVDLSAIVLAEIPHSGSRAAGIFNPESFAVKSIRKEKEDHFMPVNPLDKPIAKLREETIDQLILNYSHGELSLESFERRLDQALDAETHDALLSLTADLDLVVDSAFREHKKREFGIMTDSHDVMSEQKIISVFGNSKRQDVWNVPEEIRMLNIFGNTILDFTEAKFASMSTRINVFGVFGNVKIYVPEGIHVVSNVSCILGGVKDKAPSSHGVDVPTIILDGYVVFGNIRIKLKKTFRERLLNFAETVRAMFAAPAK